MATQQRAPRLCDVDGCATPHFARGLCSLHYRRLTKTGTVEGPPRRRVRAQCVVEGCARLTKARGLCRRHYDQERNATRVSAQERNAG